MTNLANILVVAEHDNASLKAATLNTVTAATQCGGDVHVLGRWSQRRSPLPPPRPRSPVSAKSCTSKPDTLAHGLAENLTAQIVALASGYSHLLFCCHPSR